MKRINLVAIATLLNASCMMAGGILTNTNQSARFARLMALEATTTAADAAYYNPAGTIKLSEGFHFTFSNQSAFQERIINSTFAAYKGSNAEQNDFKKYVGKASAPIIPSIQAVYRKGNWALSGSIAVVGGGGKATFDDGLSMFEGPLSTLPAAFTAFAPLITSQVPGSSLSAAGYSIDQYMTGSNFIYGGQLGAAYKINDMFSVYGGFRLNIVYNKYEGYLRNLRIGITSQNLNFPPIGIPNNNGTLTDATALLKVLQEKASDSQKPQLALAEKASTEEGARLNSKQNGWGVAPIIGFNFSYKGLNVGAKYEFKTALDVENKTTIDDTGMFRDGVNTAHDVPALLALGAAYDIIPEVTVSVGYHHFFDKSAGMANDKQKHLKGGTNEYLFGAEWRINPMFLISSGAQITRYGLADGFQSDISFSVNSYSWGFGGAANVAKNVQINIGYFFTDYSDYKMAEVAGSPSNTYTRKNKVFTAGVDFSF